MPIKISVIIAVLNMREGLTRTLKSLFAQTYPHYEIIIMDGGSTDGTRQVIESFAQRLTFWKSRKDKGHIDACNQALPFATGDYIFLLNAQDSLDPTLFAKVATVCAREPEARLISCGIHIYQHKQLIKQVVDPQVIQLTYENICFGLPLTNARFYHRSLFEDYGKFKAIFHDGSYYISNDREFLTRLIQHNIQTEIISQPLYHYYFHEDSLTFSHKNKIKICKEHIWLANQLLKLDLSRKEINLIKKWRVKENLALCYYALLQKQFKVAISALLKACLQPLQTFSMAYQPSRRALRALLRENGK